MKRFVMLVVAAALMACHQAKAQEYHSLRMAGEEYNGLAAQCGVNTRCWYAEWQRVESVLNNTYQGVQTHLTPAQIAGLRDAERAWIVSRDKNCDWISPGRGRGPDHGLSYYQCMTEAAIDRTAWLMRNIGD